MKLLLDSHSLLWWLLDDPRLSQIARTAIADEQNQALASVVSFYELRFKAGRGRLPINSESLDAALHASGFEVLPVTLRHAVRAGQLDWDHGDPWDRLLAAQAQWEQAAFVSVDKVFDEIEINRMW